MMNNDLFIESYTSLVDVLNDLTNSLESESNYEIIELNLGMIDKVTTVLKRMGDTIVLEKGVSMESKQKEGEMNVNK